MKRDKRNIEEFVKDKLDGFDAGFQNDWSEFETKLDRAILYYRMKVGALIGAVLILITLGVAGGSGLNTSNNSQASVVSEPSFLYNLSNRAPFLHALRMRSELNYRTKSTNTDPNEEGMEPSSRTTLAISTSSKRENAYGKELDNVLLLEAKSAGTPLLLEALREESKLAFREPLFLRELSNNAAEANANLGLRAEQKPSSSPIIADVREESNELTNVANLDLSGLEADLEMDQSDLYVRPPLMPVAFDKRAAYVSPLQAENPWSFSASVYPNFTFRKFKVDKEKLNLIHRDFIDATEDAETGGFSLNVGIVVSRRIGRITYLNGGVEYINYKSVSQYNFFNYREANINATTGRIDNYTLLDEPEQIVFSGNNVYHYLNFPLSISHQPWVTDHVRLNIEAGGSFMYFLGANGQAIDYQSLETIDIADREYNNSIASLHMKIGVCYYVSERLNFGLEPTMMYFTNTIYSEDYPFQVIPYSVGVNLKLQVKLN